MRKFVIVALIVGFAPFLMTTESRSAGTDKCVYNSALPFAGLEYRECLRIERLEEELYKLQHDGMTPREVRREARTEKGTK